MVNAVIIGCCVALFRFLLGKWGIDEYAQTKAGKVKVCAWCFYTWWPCVIACATAPETSIIYTPIAVIIATIGYVYLKSQPD